MSCKIPSWESRVALPSTRGPLVSPGGVCKILVTAAENGRVVPGSQLSAWSGRGMGRVCCRSPSARAVYPWDCFGNTGLNSFLSRRSPFQIDRLLWAGGGEAWGRLLVLYTAPRYVLHDDSKKGSKEGLLNIAPGCLGPTEHGCQHDVDARVSFPPKPEFCLSCLMMKPFTHTRTGFNSRNDVC